MNPFYGVIALREGRCVRKILIALAAAASLSGCSSESGFFSQNQVLSRQIPETKLKKVLRELAEFTSGKSDVSTSDLSQLQNGMDRIVHNLDSLAVQGNLKSGETILRKISESYTVAINTARGHSNEEYKEIWLQWSERLLLTRSSLQHFFSELQLNFFENKLDTQMTSDALAYIPELSGVFHPAHEARLISIYRAHTSQKEVANAILALLAESAGPLARLFIYQRFISSPNLEFAEAMAKSGLPRTTDLIGESSLIHDGPFWQPSLRESAEFGRIMDSVRDFPERWQEMKTYLESLKTIPERLSKARQFWADMHAEIDKKIDQIDAPPERRAQLKTAILQTYRSGMPAEKLSYRRDGIDFREGDIVLIQAGETGGLWETFTHSGSLLSHLMMVTFDEQGLPYSIEVNFGQILLAPLDLKAERFVVLRAKNNSEELRRRFHVAFRKLLSKDVTYDFRFDSTDNSKLYCSELAAAVLEYAEAGILPFPFSPKSQRAAELLRKSGIPSSHFYGQGSYLGSANFEFVGERIYADPAGLIRGQMILSEFKNHIGSSYSVRFWHHPDSPAIFGLSAMAQTLAPELRRGLGPQPFLFTVMVLDRLVRSVDDDVRKASVNFHSGRTRETSRLVHYKGVIADALRQAVPNHLSSVFPHSKD
jgi:hypothetical protein